MNDERPGDTPPFPTDRTPPAPLTAEDAARAGERLRSLQAALGTVVLGQPSLLEDLVTALVAGGHVLLEGVPGTAKTLAVNALAHAVDARFGRIQFTPDLMPSDVTGVGVFDPRSERFEFRPGPIFCDLCLCDEVNRAPAKTQAALLEAMQEGHVTADGETHRVPDLFTVFATQNPIEFEGTYPLPEAQLDRFLMKLTIDYPDEAAELSVLEGYASGFDANDERTFGFDAVLGRDELVALRGLAKRVRTERELLEYAVKLVRATRDDPNLVLGASPRATVALFQAARAKALIAGRDFAVPDDVKDAALAVLRHRVVLSAEAELDGVDADGRVASALQNVPAPS